MNSDVASIAVLGAGRMGRLYAQLVEQHPLTRLAALTCRTDASADHLRTDFDVPVFASEDPDVLAPIVDEIDAVIIAAPNGRISPRCAGAQITAFRLCWKNRWPTRWMKRRG